jgi:hypothetical protein
MSYQYRNHINYEPIGALPPNGNWICGSCGWGNKAECNACINGDCEGKRTNWEEKEENE